MTTFGLTAIVRNSFELLESRILLEFTAHVNFMEAKTSKTLVIMGEDQSELENLSKGIMRY